MKTRFAFIIPILLALSLPASAAEVLKGTIDVTAAAKSNATATVSFELSGGQTYAVQCDAAAYVTSSDDATVATSVNGIKVSADGLYDVVMPSRFKFISVIAVSGGAVNCKVFLVKVR